MRVTMLLLALGLFAVSSTTVDAQCGGASDAQLTESVTLILRGEQSSTWPNKEARFTTALNDAMNVNRTANHYTINTTVYAVSEVDISGTVSRVDLRLYLFAVVHPVGGVFAAEQLVTEIRAAQLFVLVQAAVFYAVDSVQVGATNGCAVGASSVTDDEDEEKFTDFTVIGIIVAVGLVVVLASAIVVVMSSRRSRHKADHSKPGPYSTVQPIPPAVVGGGFAASHVDNPNSRGTLTTGSTATSTSLVVDFGETYHEKTMHTHL